MRRREVLKWAAGSVATGALVTAAAIDARTSGATADARSKLILMAPAAAGGGWDLVAREAQQALRSDSIVAVTQVVNVPGAAGTIGLSQLAQMDGDGGIMMVTGTVMMGGITRNKAPTKLTDLTPIARLAEDFEVIAVPKASPYEDLDDLLDDWRRDPAALPIGGGSAGGVDHLLAGLLARESDIDTGTIRYVAYAGGGELTINLLSTAPGTPNVGISGYNDFRDLLIKGDLRALAVASPERLEGLDAPTLAELGLEEAMIVNWRGLVAPAGLDAEQQQTLVDIATEMVGTAHWAEVVDRNRWSETFATGAEFTDFLVDEQARIDAILAELGLG